MQMRFAGSFFPFFGENLALWHSRILFRKASVLEGTGKVQK